jgi:intracellular multiplication protein IcmB
MSSMFASLIEGLDNAFIWLGQSSKQTLPDYCDLETAQDETVLVARDGSLMSLIRVDGVKSIVGLDNFEGSIVDPLESALSNSLKNKSHMIQVFFTYDPERTQAEIRRLNEPAYQTMERLRLDLGDMLDEKVRNLANWSCFESCHMALWTRPGALTKSEKKIGERRNKEANKDVVSNFARSQNPNRGNMMIADRHRSFVATTIDDLKRSQVVCHLMEAHEAARETRMSVDPDFTDSKWQAALPGDKALPELRRGFLRAEEWDVVWPKLSWQVCPRDAKIVADNIVQVGSRIYAPIYIDLFPRRPKVFGDLFSRLMNNNLPWRASFMIEGSGLNGMGMKKLMAQLLGFSNSQNKLVSRALDELQEYGQTNAVVKFRASFCTWAPKGHEEELGRRLSDLANAVQGWGECDVSEMTGDPVAGFASSAIGFTFNQIGTPAAAPLFDVLKMMPLAQPSSPWTEGAVTFRSPQGKLLPYQPGSSKQTTWITLIFARPGSGKSVLMNMTNLALCLAPGIKRLPRIAIIDIGPSSSGLISLLREALPEGQKHLASYHRMRMTREFSINPFDTQLGCRFPTALEQQFLINMVSLLVTDVNSEEPFTGMTGLVAQVVNEMYRRVSDTEQPHLYTPGVEPTVDRMMEQTLMPVDRRTSWWEVVDYLFQKNHKHEASLAQRHAVPLLAEASLCAKDEKIRNQLAGLKIETSESIIDAFTRMIGDALVAYPILARPTAFDIGESRVVSLDLDEVAKTGGAVADRQTAVMYMLARYVLARDFYITKEALADMPYSVEAKIDCPAHIPAQAYRDHHSERIEHIREDLKRICYDEFHRTAKAKTVREQVLVDMREGRKWAVDVTLASQALEDFDKTMIEFATAIFVMDGGSKQVVDGVAERFGFADPVERSALMNSVRGPQAGGGTFLAKFYTKQGIYTLLLTSTLGPIELWAFSTTAEDVALRNKLYDKLTPKVARRVLGERFRNGSAKDEIDKRKQEMRQSGFAVDGDGSNVVDQLVDELMNFADMMRRRGRLKDV